MPSDDDEYDDQLEESEAEETFTFEFIINEKGKKKLYCDDFGFHRNVTKGTRTIWKCEMRSGECSASATTVQLSDGSSRVARINNVHNHPVDLDRKQKFIGRHAMKVEAIRNLTAASTSICQEAIRANEDLGSYFGTTQRLRDVIGYTRRKLLTAPKKPKPETVKLKSSKRQAPPQFEFFALEDVKIEKEDIMEEGENENESCKFCCESNTQLTNSVYDDVIVKFFNVMPNLSLSDSVSTRVCKQCFVKAKVCVDFIQKIQLAHKSNNICHNNEQRTTPQDTFCKLKRIGAVDIKKVDNARAASSKTSQKPSAKSSQRKRGSAKIDSDEDYQPENYTEKKSSRSSKKRKAANEDSDGDLDEDEDFTQASNAVIVEAPTKYTCFKCRESFSNADDLLAHTKTCKVKLKCHICCQVFASATMLKNHLKNHEEKVKSVCDQCGLEFSSPFQLDNHIEAKHVRIVRPDCVFRCSKCSKSFSSHLDLMTHFKIHQQEVFDEPKTCEVCAREFYDNTSFSRHFHRKKDKICDICGKALDSRGKLIQHMRFVHSGIKDYPCDFCHKAYARAAARLKHREQAHPNA